MTGRPFDYRSITVRWVTKSIALRPFASAGAQSTIGADVTNILKQLAETDRRIRDTNQRVDECRARIARRAKNPALAEQAAKGLPVLLGHLKELAIYRKRLVVAQELAQGNLPKRLPQLPHYLR